MAQKDDLQTAKGFMTWLWQFVKTHYEIPKNDEGWERLVSDADNVPAEFDNYFSRSCILGFVGWVEDRSKCRVSKKGPVQGLIRQLCGSLTDEEIRSLTESIIKMRHVDLREIPLPEPKQQTLDDIWRTE